jgi:ArsR family transcriptional regulator, lead/cadmium/zinc/bismuth-responsive transcriptional repressor
MLTPREHQRLEEYIHGIDINRLANTFDALSEPNRCLIFRALLKGKAVRVSDLASVVGISDALASQHLKILLQAGLVERQKEAKNVYYNINESNPLVGALQKAVEV